MATDLVTVPELVRVLDLTGVFANALLGGAVARSHGLDPVGFAALAIVSGLGGGIIRDTLLQRGRRRIDPLRVPDHRVDRRSDRVRGAVRGACLGPAVSVRGRAGVGLLGGGGRTENPDGRVRLATGGAVRNDDRGRRWRGARHRSGQDPNDLRWEHAVRDVRGNR